MNTTMTTSSETENLDSIDISQVANILSHLQLSVIPQEFVDQVISSHYNYCTFPESYELIVMPEINFLSIITESCELISFYLKQSPSMHIIWDEFIDSTYCIQPIPLICLLNCFIQNGIENLHQFNSRKNSLSAARLFFLASTFKGSKNIRFFNIYILTKCTELIKSCISMLYSTNGINNDDIQLDDDEKNDLMADLLDIVKDIRIMINRFKFFDEINSLDLIIDIMIDVTRLEKTNGNILEQVPTQMLSFSVLAYNAYDNLTNMFKDNCGATFNIAQKLMNYLVLGLLVDEQREMQLTTRQFNAIRDHHLSFIHKLTKKLDSSFDHVLEILLHHLIHRGPDRNELKPRQLHIIIEVWRLCPNNIRIKMKYYLLRMVYNVDSKIRIVALETLFKLLSEPEEIEPEDLQLKQFMPATKHKFILAVILSKFQDQSISVRAKAFSIFIALTAGLPTATAHHTALVRHVLIDPYVNIENLNQISFSKQDFHDFYQYLKHDLANFNSNNITNNNIYPGAKILLWVLNVHAHHEQVHIRRLSLTLLCNLFLINKKFIGNCYLSLLINSCSDYSMSIRKAVVSRFTDLILKYPDNQNILKYWFQGLIHLVGDHDKKIQELTVDCMNRVILKNIKPYSVETITNNDQLDYLPWRILDNALNEHVGKYMMLLFEKWHNNGLLTDHIIKNVITYVDSSKNEWSVHSSYFLQLLSHQLTIPNMSPVIRYFDTHFDLWFSNEKDPVMLNNMLTHAQIIIDILFLNHKVLDKKTQQRLLDKLEEHLFHFKVPTRLISKSLDLYTVLQTNISDREKQFKKLFEIICNFIETSTSLDNEDIMIRHIYTLGDIALVQQLCITHKLQQYLLDFLSKSDQYVSAAFQAIVVLTIGKLSVIDDCLAKEAIVQFGAIIKNQHHPSIKINALTALADLCLVCTTLVEQAIPEMCVCLRSDNLSVKRVALKLLTGLILEDYIKLRNVVFFALLCMLEDRDLLVRQETSSFIVNYLLIKNKDIMERKLIEVIFHFNGYTGIRSSGIQDCFTNPEMKAFFSMEGDAKRASRHCVYRFMLTHMSDNNKLKLMVKIFNNFDEILKDVIMTENQDIRECAIQVMKDAFWILKAKEMALTSGMPCDNNDDPGTLENVTDLAKKQVVMETYKTVMTAYIIPSILKLKYDLEKNKKILPTVINDLYSYLCVLTSGKSPLKTEIFELLSVDSDLISEITYDNKQLKLHKKQLNGHYGSKQYDSEDDNDNDDREINLIEDLEYITWSQIMELSDNLEQSGIDKSIQAQMQKELVTSEISNQDAVADHFLQLNGELTRPSDKTFEQSYDNNLPCYKLFNY